MKLNINKVYYNKLTKGENVFNEKGDEIDYREVTSKGLKISHMHIVAIQPTILVLLKNK